MRNLRRMDRFGCGTAVSAALVFVAAGRAQVVSAPVIAPAGPLQTMVSQSVSKVASIVSLSVTTPLTVVYGQTIDGQAQVAAADGTAVTGTVIFYDGAASFCTLTVKDGASCPDGAGTGFGVGTHEFTAVYSGDATHAAAASNAVTVMVDQDTTTTAMASSANPVRAGGSVVYTATVAGAHGPISGAVTFFDGSSAMASAGLVGGGTAALSVAMMTPGTHAITAVYGGSANSAGSASAAVNEVVEAALPTSTTTLSASANPVATGQSVSFTAVVSGAGGRVSTGSVVFVEGGTMLETVPVGAGGMAVWSTSALSVGNHSILARYSGDGGLAPSVSTALNEVVQDASASGTFGISVDTITVAAGETVTVPVKVTGGASLAKAVTLSCSGLPAEATCSSAAGSAASAGMSAMLKISTLGPRDCGTLVPYGGFRAGLPVAGPMLAGLLVIFVPRRRRVVKGLLAVVCAVTAMGVMTGCGTGNCTDLGTRPGRYTITVTGSAGGTLVSQKAKLVVTP